MKRIIGVNSNCYHGFSIYQALDGISRAGFRYVELTATKGWTEHVFPDMKFQDLISVKDKLRENGLTAFAVSGHCNLMDLDRIQDFILNIQLAAFFGCEYIISSIGEAHLADQKQASMQEVAHHIKALNPYLEEYNLKLGLEVHGEHGSGHSLKEIVDLIDLPRVMMNYDTANAIYYGNVDLQQDISSCVDQIGFMHIKDKAGANQEWNFPALGQGFVDFPSIFQTLSNAENDCPLSIEIEFTQAGPKDLAEVDQAVKTSFEYLSKLGFLI